MFPNGNTRLQGSAQQRPMHKAAHLSVNLQIDLDYLHGHTHHALQPRIRKVITNAFVLNM